MSSLSLSISIAELNSLLKSRAKGKGVSLSKEEVFEFVKELCYKHNYVPLAPYDYVQLTLRHLRLKERPIDVVKDLAFVILNWPDEYVRGLEESAKEILELARWGVQALQTQFSYNVSTLYRLAKVVRGYFEGGPIKAKEVLSATKREGPRFKTSEYKRAVLVADVLICTNFAKCMYFLKDLLDMRRPQEFKAIRPTFQTMMLWALANLRGYPELRMSEELARAVVKAGLEARLRAVKLFKEGRSSIEVYEGLRRDLLDILIGEGVDGRVAERALLCSLSALMDDVISTRMYMAYYGVLGIDIIEALALLKL